MELVPEGKNFILVQESELPEILEFLSGHLPEALKFHQALKTFLNDRVWDFHFYVSKSWPDDPVALHFPGMTSSPNGQLYESFCVFCPLDKLDCLSLLRSEDVLIDWSKSIFLNFTHASIMERIEDFYSGLGTVEKVCGDVYVCTGDVWDQNLQDPPLQDADVQELRAEHAKAIHGLYPANDMESLELFEKLLRALPAYGVFSSSGELAAWMVQSYYGAMFSMQTRPQFRRKGYGTHLAQTLTKLVIKRGYVPFVVIRPENEASLSLYSKLGFTRAYRTVRAVLRPFGCPKPDETSASLEEQVADFPEVPIEFVDVPPAFADDTIPAPEEFRHEEVNEAYTPYPESSEPPSVPHQVPPAPEQFREDAVPAIPAPEAFRKVMTSEVFRKIPDLAPPEFIIGTLESLAKETDLPVVAAPEAFRTHDMAMGLGLGVALGENEVESAPSDPDRPEMVDDPAPPTPIVTVAQSAAAAAE